VIRSVIRTPPSPLSLILRKLTLLVNMNYFYISLPLTIESVQIYQKKECRFAADGYDVDFAVKAASSQVLY